MRAARPDAETVTVVLIHGGPAPPGSWDRLLPYLDGATLTVDLPGRRSRPADLATLSVDVEVTSVTAHVEDAAAPGPGIVVAVIRRQAFWCPASSPPYAARVGAVVLNAALVPAEGGCGHRSRQERHRDGLRMAVAAAEKEGRTITLPGPPADPEAFRRVYGGDPLDDETLAFVVHPERSVPDTVHH